MKTFNFNPGGNYTTLVDNLLKRIKPNEYANTAKSYLNDRIEQVGFIVPGKKTSYRLEMMGGEFCINALRALGFWINQNSEATNITVESSGTSQLIDLEIETWVKIKLPKQFENVQLTPVLNLVKLEGICHFVLETTNSEPSYLTGKLKQFKKNYASEINSFSAIGLMAINKNRITPLVEVVPTQTRIFETACGSGTLAAYIASSFTKQVWKQPSQSVFIVTDEENYFYLNGPVSRLRKTRPVSN